MLGLGLGTFPFPRALSAVYGVPVVDPAGEAFVRATGARDVALAVILLIFLAFEWYDPAAVALVVTGVLALADFANAVRVGASASPLAVHSGGAVGFILIGAMLAFGERPETAPVDVPTTEVPAPTAP